MEMENGFSPYPDFLRIFNSHEHSQHLVFPDGYNKYYPDPLPRTAVLKKPEGIFWTVKWTINQEETVSFQDGWEKFVKDNGIIEKDFLLFIYDGYRSFWVQIHRKGLPLKPSSPVNIQEISDDEDEKTGDDVGHRVEDDHHMEDEDTHENMIISLSLGSSDEVGGVSDDDDDYDYDDTPICEVNKASGSSKKGRVKKNNHGASIKPKTYLDDPKNPFFISTSSCSRRVLVIAMQAIRDYVLKFDRTVNLIDGFGVLKRKVGVWKDRVVVYKWDEMYERNNAKTGDVILCEIKREQDVVRSIKVHFVRK